ncbi:hypothetical protein Btru_061129 [Bulinus truncatus]|nr:hypothetical protein Btru_061129 [Bulinus truncatus]
MMFYNSVKRYESIVTGNAGFYYNEASGSLVCEGCGSTVDVLALSSSSRIINRYYADGCTYVNNGEEPDISGTNCEINISTDRDPKGEIEGSFSMVSNHSEENDYELPENDQKPNSLSCPVSEKVQPFDEEKHFNDLTQMQGTLYL